jgi:glycosyltransferase A (GT-A) superfamily protein (DUF2064 family)
MKTKTAILLFANSAKKEAERKSFLSVDVFSALNRQILKTVEKSGITFFHFTEKQQIGSSFGERFSNAIESVFKKGFTNIITIGNDTPHLKIRHLIDTLHQLEKTDLVLGPAKDGGFYLMGIKKDHFNKETFLKLPWQTNRLRASIISIANSKNLKIQFLEQLTDLDSKEDIQSIINSFKGISLSISKLLHQLFFSVKNIFFEYKIYIYKTSFSQNFNKGSPPIFA